MNRTLRLKSTVPFLLLFAAFDLSQGQTLTTLVDFDGSNGAYPELVSLAQGRDGNFYGTTLTRGPNGSGTVFSVTTDGQLTTGYGFCSKRNCVDGEGPSAGMVLWHHIGRRCKLTGYDLPDHSRRVLDNSSQF